MRKMFQSNALSSTNPTSLLNLVWFSITFHFCRRGQEGLRNLTKDAYKFSKDANGREFVTMQFNESTKNHPGTINNDFQSRKRMYSDGSEKCPVNALKLYLSKLNPGCDALFQRPIRSFHSGMLNNDVWYERSPLGMNQISNMMGKISKEAELSKVYTNHCIRASAITTLNNAGVETRMIMTLSEHRNEASVRSYCKDISEQQKQYCSDILLSAASGQMNSNQQAIISKQNNANNNVMPNVASHAMPSTSASSTNVVNDSVNLSIPCVQNESNVRPIQNRFFQNCTFNGNVNLLMKTEQ